MDKTRFWTRVGDWFKHPQRSTPFVSALRSPQEAVVACMEGNGNGHGPSETHSERTHEAVLSLPAIRRQGENRNGEDRFAKIEALVDSLQEHFSIQDQRSELVAHSLDRLAASLAHLPDVSRAQIEILSAIRDGMEVQTGRTRRLEESLGQLPQLADAQRETMASIGRQLDLSRQTNDHTTKVLDQFQQAVSALGDATTASAGALRQWHTDSHAKEQRMVAVLEQQTKRFTFFACVAIASALLAAMMGLAAAWVN